MGNCCEKNNNNFAPDPAKYFRQDYLENKQRVRESKEQHLNEILSTIKKSSSSEEKEAESPSADQVIRMLEQCWQCGTMFSMQPEMILEDENPWLRFANEIEEELQVLDLRTGEEELGHSIIAQAYTCVPPARG